MCEKFSCYKDFFAHIYVSLDPPLRGGFYFVRCIRPPRLSFASGGDSQELLYFQPRASGNTPHQENGGFHSCMGCVDCRAWHSFPGLHQPLLRRAAYTPETAKRNTVSAEHALTVSGKDDRKWPLRVPPILCKFSRMN